MKARRWTLIGSLAVLAQGAALSACSSADTPEDQTGGTAGTGTGGTTAGTGTGGTATGGTATGGTATGGTATGGTATGGTATGGTATGGTGGPNPPECTGIRSNMPCPVEGTMCPTLVCGLADSGSRSCNCTGGTWMCTSCDFTNSPEWIRTPPDPLPACPAEAADEVACLNPDTVCGPQGSEVCACYEDSSDGLIWDCDSRPSIWPAP